MFERKTILDRLQNNDRVTTNKNEALTFARLIEEGKVNKAIQILEKPKKGGILPLSDETFEIFSKKSRGSRSIRRQTTQRNTPRSASCYLQKYKFRNDKML